MALRLDKDRPTRSQTAERVVEAAGDPDQLCWNRAVEVRATEARGALERAILVEDDAFAGERDPGQEIRQAGRGAAVFCKVHHGVSPQLRRSDGRGCADRSEEHTSELQSLMRISYAVFCLKKKTTNTNA